MFQPDLFTKDTVAEGADLAADTVTLWAGSERVDAAPHRNARKDAHDFVYCLEHHPGGLDAAIGAFKGALAGLHADAVQGALVKLKTRFVHDDPDQAYRRDGPVAVARFEDNDADAGDNAQGRDLRILRQRRVADLIGNFLGALASGE